MNLHVRLYRWWIELRVCPLLLHEHLPTVVLTHLYLIMIFILFLSLYSIPASNHPCREH